MSETKVDVLFAIKQFDRPFLGNLSVLFYWGSSTFTELDGQDLTYKMYVIWKKVASKIGGSVLVLLGFSPSKLFKKKNASKHKNSEAQTALHIPVVQNNLVKNQPKKIEYTLEKGFVT